MTEESIPESSNAMGEADPDAHGEMDVDVVVVEFPSKHTAVKEANGDESVNDTANDLPFADALVEDPRVSFVSYLMSPIFTLAVGSQTEVLLTAHQALLVQSPFFAAACADFGSVNTSTSLTRISMRSAVSEFLYTGEYYPRKLAGQRVLESDPSVPPIDATGDQLLKHARVYTLASKWELANLRVLASSKIHCVDSTAKGEIAYARYIYAHTVPDDAIRSPVANFWATRSHTLRAEAEPEFRDLCIDFPLFAYNILTRVLDEKLKRECNEKKASTTGGSRKRPRHGNV